eukprot:TRINITY_DN1789_c0_g7_i1.p1 TRINITY_DN1789_c0_g7~~TRINITY_DN1789_c0_g7_i1.p1  ORF type:complete len:1163 (+),score=248.15 TRINITY_DN1789_c0_g7_i1:50-3490(+)
MRPSMALRGYGAVVDGADLLASPVSTKATIVRMMERKDDGARILSELGGNAQVARRLGIDLRLGVPPGQVNNRRQRFGENKMEDPEPLSYWTILQDALSDRMMMLLMALGVIAIIINETVPEQGETEVHHGTAWIEGGMILFAVMLVTVVTTANDYSKELKFRELDEAVSKDPVTVTRGGHPTVIDTTELVVGDIVDIAPGDVIGADGLLIAGEGVACDESACTGENDPWKKVPDQYDPSDHKDPFLISGTNVVSASNAKYLCVAVGENSFSGKLEKQTQSALQKKMPTPLQEKLEDLADLVGNIGIAVATALFLSCTAIVMQRWASGGAAPAGRDFLNWAIVGVSLVVVAVPEGLPLAVTIALAYSMQAMMKENNVVRSLAACETMGAATSICSDKTGTLTTNQMTTVGVHFGAGSWSRTVTASSDPESTWRADGYDEIVVSGVGENLLREMGNALAFNSTATDVSGNKTEQGLMRWICRLRLPGDASEPGFEKVKAMRSRCEASGAYRRVHPFCSATKSMTTVVQNAFGGGRVLQYTKGAPEIVLEACNKYLPAEGGDEVEMSDDDRVTIVAAIKAFATTGLRTLGVAMRTHSYMPEGDEPILEELTWLGVCALQDPPRSDVPAAVQACFKAGVTVRMCTGDNRGTAEAIAKQCHLITDTGEGALVMEGPEFRRMFREDKDAFIRHLPNLRVLARCSPLDKQLLVGSLMLLGETVAVTGDGTNDAPALALADVGFAMDDGTKVAKKACKIILLDNNFVSVVKAVKWGRNVNDSIRKFLQFQFTVNVVLLIITFIGTVSDVANDHKHPKWVEPSHTHAPLPRPPQAAGDDSGGGWFHCCWFSSSAVRASEAEAGQSHVVSTLTPIQLLWANLIMDTLAALALATENPHEDENGHSNLLDRLPTHRSAPLISRKMWRFIGSGAACQLAVLGFLMYCKSGMTEVGVLSTFPDPAKAHQTTVFNTFIFMQIFNWFVARNLYDEPNFMQGFDRSTFFLPIVGVCVLVQFLMVELGGTLLGTVPLSAEAWLISLVLAFLMWPVGVLMRYIPVRELPPSLEPPSESKHAAIDQVFDDVCRQKGERKSQSVKGTLLGKFRAASKVIGWASRHPRNKQHREPTPTLETPLVGSRTALTDARTYPHSATWTSDD